MAVAMIQSMRRAFLAFAIIAAWPSVAGGQGTIDELLEQAGLRAGPVAMRDIRGWDPGATIVVRDLGFDGSALTREFADADIVLVDSPVAALQHARGAGALVGFCDAELLDAAHGATWVQIYSAGAERCLSSPQVAAGEVVLTNMQKMSSPVIAEHAIAMLLALARNLPAFAGAMESGQWRREAAYTGSMTTLAGKTMLVVGLGGIGTEIARRGSALGMRVVGTRNSSRSGPPFVDYVGLSHELADLAAQADVIVNALPLTKQTRHLLDASFFGPGLSRRPFFINVGRGATVDSDALLAALKAGHVAGAGLDVTDPEPLPPAHELWRQPNVIITPHVSGRGGDRRRHLLLVRENVRRYLAGDALLNVVDPGRGY